MKKNLKAILGAIIILVIIAIIIVIRLKNEKNNTITYDYGEIYVETKKSENTSSATFGVNKYDEIYDIVEKIHASTNGLTDEEIIAYYEDNKKDIETYHISSVEDFYLIAKGINEIKTNDESATYSNTKIDTSSQTQENDMSTFKASLEFTNGESFQIKISISDENEMILKADFAFSNILKEYGGNVATIDFARFIYKFENESIAKIKSMTTKKSDNDLLKQYEEQTSTINSLGIYGSNDYLSIATQIIATWTQGTKVTGHVIDESTYANNGTYTSFDVTFKFSNNESMKVKMAIANSKETTPVFVLGEANSNE